MKLLYTLFFVGLSTSSALDLDWCLNGGDLQIAATGQKVCVCPNGFAGTECQHPATEWCTFSAMDSDAFCTNNGNCRGTTISSEHPGCNCIEGRVGDHCEYANEMEYQSVRAAMGVLDTGGSGSYSSLSNSPYQNANNDRGLSAGAIAGVVIAVIVVAVVMVVAALFVHRMNQSHTTHTRHEPDFAIEADGTTTFSEGNRMSVEKKKSMFAKMKGKAGDKPITDIEVAKDWDVPDKTLDAMNDNDGILSPTATSTQHYVQNENIRSDFDNGEEEIAFASDDRERSEAGVAVPPKSSFRGPDISGTSTQSPARKSVIDTQGFPQVDEGFTNKDKKVNLV